MAIWDEAHDTILSSHHQHSTAQQGKARQKLASVKQCIIINILLFFFLSFSRIAYYLFFFCFERGTHWELSHPTMLLLRQKKKLLTTDVLFFFFFFFQSSSRDSTQCNATRVLLLFFLYSRAYINELISETVFPRRPFLLSWQLQCPLDSTRHEPIFLFFIGAERREEKSKESLPPPCPSCHYV